MKLGIIYIVAIVFGVHFCFGKRLTILSPNRTIIYAGNGRAFSALNPLLFKQGEEEGFTTYNFNNQEIN